MTVDEVDRSTIAVLVVVDQLVDRVNGQADARGADETLAEIKNVLVDENGQPVAVGQIRVDVDFIGFFHLTNAEVPVVTRFIRAYRFEDAI